MSIQTFVARRAVLSTLVPALLFGAVMASRAADKTDVSSTADVRIFMRAKLASSHRVMEGLILGDFDAMLRGAEEMKKTSEAATWPRTEDRVYRHYSDAFRRQCEKLARLAREKNHEAAQFVYLHMTTTCIDCHNYVRGAFTLSRDESHPSGPVQLIPTEWE